MYRVGLGFDVHRLVPGRRLVLAGVELTGVDRGLLGHSDADVVIHALCDALLGAAALGDIGSHFPDSDPRYKDADSSELLQQVLKLITRKGYDIVNIDLIVMAQWPKIQPLREKMRAKLAQLTAVPLENVNLKATTTEQLGFVGREEGIAAQAVVLLKERKAQDDQN